MFATLGTGKDFCVKSITLHLSPPAAFTSFAADILSYPKSAKGGSFHMGRDRSL